MLAWVFDECREGQYPAACREGQYPAACGGVLTADALGIPAEEIRSIRLATTFLWKRHFWQKQGILDVLVELNDNSKVNIELQIKMLEAWDKRSLFYLAKMFTEDLRRGEKYHRLKKCICINIVDFNVDEEPAYHRVYRLRDKEGHGFSGMFEVHIIELGKELKGRTALDDWIRLINAKTKEELNMIRTMNPGILEAIEEVKAMSLRKGLRALYEVRLKEMRDRMAREDYVRGEGREAGKAEGKAEGMAEGKAEGRAEGKAEDVLRLLEEKGSVSPGLCRAVYAQKNVEVLEQWLILAARAEKVEDFCVKAKLNPAL